MKDTELKLIAAKGRRGGAFRLWYGTGEDDLSLFVLTLTPRHVAHALRKTVPPSLEEIEAYAERHHNRLKLIARNAIARGQKAEVLD